MGFCSFLARGSKLVNLMPNSIFYATLTLIARNPQHKKQIPFLISKNGNNISLSFSSSASTYTYSSTASLEMSDVPRRKVTTTSIHIMALDGIVNVNSLFTLALFLGITSTNTNSTLVGDDDAACAAGPSVSEGLIACHVYSFSCFLFSSLIAMALKQAINISKGAEEEDALGVSGVRNEAVSFVVKVDTLALRMGTMVSGFGSVFGCGFLVMALVDLVQIKLGTLACGSHYTIAAVAPLLFLVPLALIIYIILVLYAFTR